MQPPIDQATFGVRLKRRRQTYKMTQEQLAEHVGCTPSMLQKIEQGARMPSPALAARLAEFLDGFAAAPPSEAPARAAPRSPALPLRLTKLMPPRIGSRIVPRTRLTDGLSAEDLDPLTLVVAPAGWGKTTLLAAWIQQRARIPDPSVAWLSLDENDTDVTLFLRYVIAALSRHSALGAGAELLLDAPQPSIEAVLSLLINDLVALDQPVVLVLDDYHRVTAAEVHRTLASLIAHLPPSLHLVIATREDPPLPLTSLRARGQLREIRAPDLRFTVAEASSFFAGSMGLELEAREIAALERRTEGWIAGLQLAALAIREQADRSDFLQAFTGNHRLVLDYLSEEVLIGLPAHQHEFLLQTSILDQLCGPLCDAVLDLASVDAATTTATADRLPAGRPRVSSAAYSQLVLEQLERANLFVVALDGERQWFRYHHLFGAVLRQRLQRGAAPDMIEKLHARAADWYEANALPGDAIDHALAARQWQRAARLIEGSGDALVQGGSYERLRRTIVALPQAVRDELPRLLYFHARSVRQVYDLTAGRELFAQAAAAFARIGDVDGRGASLVRLADCCRMLADYDAARHALDEALAAPLPPGLRAVALLSRAYEAMLSDAWHLVIPNLQKTLDALEEF